MSEKPKEQPSPISPVSRNINSKETLILWAKAAGRCERCKRLLYEDQISGAEGNFGQRAHIIPHGDKKPPRYEFKVEGYDTAQMGNIMLLCPMCHKEIDSNPQNYPPKDLLDMKTKHEMQVLAMTEKELKPIRIVTFFSKIASKNFSVHDSEIREKAKEVLYPSRDIVQLGCSDIDDKDNLDWITFKRNAKSKYFQCMGAAIDNSSEYSSFALFPLAPIYQLIFLGNLFTTRCDLTYFNPYEGKWICCKNDNAIHAAFNVRRTSIKGNGKIPALAIAISADVDIQEIAEKIPDVGPIWILEATSKQISMPLSESTIRSFGKKVSEVLSEIEKECKDSSQLMLFPAMPAASAVELGRQRNIKLRINEEWIVFDYNKGWKNTNSYPIKANELQ